MEGSVVLLFVHVGFGASGGFGVDFHVFEAAADVFGGGGIAGGHFTAEPPTSDTLNPTNTIIPNAPLPAPVLTITARHASSVSLPGFSIVYTHPVIFELGDLRAEGSAGGDVAAALEGGQAGGGRGGGGLVGGVFGWGAEGGAAGGGGGGGHGVGVVEPGGTRGGGDDGCDGGSEERCDELE